MIKLRLLKVSVNFSCIKMNVLWSKPKKSNYKLYNQDTMAVYEQASGDGTRAPGRCCRLCGGESSLQSFRETYVLEGVEERYDHLLYECFGVRVSPSDCMICEWCIRQLRRTERFRALVHAAFDKPSSEASTVRTIPIQKDIYSKAVTGETNIGPEKQIIDLLKLRMSELPKRREVRKKFMRNQENGGKRINISCEICRQRYPMIMPTDGIKKFVCSRCKKNGEIRSVVCRKCNIGMPPSMMKEHMELHAKADLRAKTRLLARQTKKVIKRINSASKDRAPPKFECHMCPKKYAIAKNLGTHVRSAHGDNVDTLCRECGKMLESLEKLEEHLRWHPPLRKVMCRSLANSNK